MTARERTKRTMAECDHRFSGVCHDCVTAALIAHAEAVRNEAARVARQWCRQGEPGAETASYIAAAIEYIEVS